MSVLKVRAAQAMAEEEGPKGRGESWDEVMEQQEEQEEEEGSGGEGKWGFIGRQATRRRN